MLTGKKLYKKCPRCELNYIEQSEDICEVCEREIKGECDEYEIDLMDICPFCERNALPDGEEMCNVCRKKHQKEKTE